MAEDFCPVVEHVIPMICWSNDSGSPHVKSHRALCFVMFAILAAFRLVYLLNSFNSSTLRLPTFLLIDAYRLIC